MAGTLYRNITKSIYVFVPCCVTQKKNIKIFPFVYGKIVYMATNSLVDISIEEKIVL